MGMTDTRLSGAPSVAVEYDSTVSGSASLEDAMCALASIAAEVLLGLATSEAVPVAA